MAKGTSSVVVKKKRWIKIQAPKLFNEQIMGESYVGEPQELVGRKVAVSLMVLTGEPQRQSINVAFRITGIKNDMAVTEVLGYKILPSSAKKLMRRNRSKIDDSFVVESADKKFVRIKPLIVTRGRTTGSVMASMRKLERAYLAKAISKMDTDSILRDAIQKRLQHGLSQMLRRLYPVSACEIRQLEFFSADKIKDLKLNITLPPESLPESRKKEVPKEQKESATEKAPAETPAA